MPIHRKELKMTTQLLQNKVALVTGGNRGIGAAVAKVFAGHGATAVVNYNRSREPAEQVVSAITTAGGRALACQADVTDREQVERMVQDIIGACGRLDVLVNNARPVPMSFTSYLATDAQEIEARVIAELRAVDACCRSVFPIMKEQGGGRIINVSTVAARQTQAAATTAACSVAKAAMEALSRVIALEFAPYSIIVNVVAPGLVLTERVKTRRSPEELDRLAAGTPLRQLASPEDVAGAILLFALEEARFVTGQYVYASGGTVML
jgi:3-oxoacyl-[acyl-carrier protein] reductase